MKLGRALQEIGYTLLSCLKGLGVVWMNFFKFKERKQTVLYPLEEIVVPPSYRGALVFRPERCIVCELCEKACPVPGTRTEKTIELYHHVGGNKKRELDEFYIDYASCINCYLCVEACPVDALLPGSSFELSTIDPLAQYDRSRMIYGMRQLEAQPESADAGTYETAHRHTPRGRPIKASEAVGELPESTAGAAP
jgi:NADH-quinone oxidoreductase subunit I